MSKRLGMQEDDESDWLVFLVMHFFFFLLLHFFLFSRNRLGAAPAFAARSAARVEAAKEFADDFESQGEGAELSGVEWGLACGSGARRLRDGCGS